MSTIFCVGIGGIGLSGLARILHAHGETVAGSDATRSSLTDALTVEDISVKIGHVAENLPSDCTRVIYSQAVPLDVPELVLARERGILVQTYPEAVGEFSDKRQTIAIAGTHGKTTTTAMTALALTADGVDPTVLVGSLVTPFGKKNVRLGTGPFVLEACEYQRAFLHYHPHILVLTNTEPDHLDYYKDAQDYASAFESLMGQVQPGGTIILQIDDAGNQSFLRTMERFAVLKISVKTVSLSDAAADYFLSADGEVVEKGTGVCGKLALHVPGRHNRSNALLAFAVGRALALSSTVLLKALNDFPGTWRRFEYKGLLNGAPVYDDYGHHPTEIVATLAAVREKFSDRRIVCVFQPHQHSRTRLLWDRFMTAFAGSDLLIVPNIYAARDTAEDKAEITAERFVAALQKNHSVVSFGDGLENTAKFLAKNVTANDVVLIMGAGDVTILTTLLSLKV